MRRIGGLFDEAWSLRAGGDEGDTDGPHFHAHSKLDLLKKFLREAGEELGAEGEGDIHQAAIGEGHMNMRGHISVVAAGAAVTGEALAKAARDEGFEGVVDGGETEARVGVVDGAVEFFGGGVRGCRGEGRVDALSLTCASQVVGPEKLADLFDRVHHFGLPSQKASIPHEADETIGADWL